MMRTACARSCSTHHARSSKAEESNSKLLNDSLERKPVLALGRRQQALLHRFRLQQICSFPLRGDLPPHFDGNEYSGRLPGFVGDDLDIHIRHNFSLPAPCRPRVIGGAPRNALHPSNAPILNYNKA